MTAISNSVSRRAALATVLLAALAAVNVNAADSSYTPKFTWWAILIMMIGIVALFAIGLVIYFCVFRKEDSEDGKDVDETGVRSEGSAAVPPAHNHNAPVSA